MHTRKLLVWGIYVIYLLEKTRRMRSPKTLVKPEMMDSTREVKLSAMVLMIDPFSIHICMVELG